MISVKVIHKTKSDINITESMIRDFVNNNTELPHTIGCVHLKNKPVMFLSVCLKKHFVFVDIYPECKKCKQINKFKSDILKFIGGNDFED